MRRCTTPVSSGTRCPTGRARRLRGADTISSTGRAATGGASGPARTVTSAASAGGTSSIRPATRKGSPPAAHLRTRARCSTRRPEASRTSCCERGLPKGCRSTRSRRKAATLPTNWRRTVSSKGPTSIKDGWFSLSAAGCWRMASSARFSTRRSGGDGSEHALVVEDEETVAEEGPALLPVVGDDAGRSGVVTVGARAGHLVAACHDNHLDELCSVVLSNDTDSRESRWLLE